MSMTVAQIYTTNPTTTIADNDLIYLVQSPYTPGTDSAIIGSNLKALFVPAAGSTSITTLGTITTGVWNATTISTLKGGTGLIAYTLGDTLYASAANTLSRLTGNITTTKNFLSQTGTGVVSAAPIWSAISASDIGSGQALTRVDDTNVTLTLGGTPSTALLAAASLTVGWTGTLSGTRGGTGVNNGSSTITIGGNVTFAGAFTFAGTVTGNTTVTFPTSGTLATTSQIPTGAALTKTDDTNVTLTLGGSPTTALVNAASIALGWTGTLSGTRGGTGVNNGASTITLGGSLTTSGAFASTFTMTGITTVTFPTSGTLATTSQIITSPLTTKGDIWAYSTTNDRLPVATGDGKILQVLASASTGLAYSTPTYPSASGTSGKFIISDGTNNVYSTSTIPTSAGATANKLLLSDGTNYVLSTPTFPNASATSGKIIKSDGTNWTASTETYAAPGTSGNIMTSDGTNWTSTPPATSSVAQRVSTETGAVNTGSTLLPYDDTIPQNTEGNQWMTLAITPKNSSNILVIDVTVVQTCSAAGNLSTALFQDTTANALAAVSQNQNNAGGITTTTFRHIMTAGTTSATTFKVRGGCQSVGTVTFNGSAGGRIFGGVMASSIMITEYTT